MLSCCLLFYCLYLEKGLKERVEIKEYTYPSHFFSTVTHCHCIKFPFWPYVISHIQYSSVIPLVCFEKNFLDFFFLGRSYAGTS